MTDQPREPKRDPDPPPPPKPRRIDPAADADSPTAIPVYPPAQGDGS